MKLKKLSSPAFSRIFFCGAVLSFALSAKAQTNDKVAVGTRNPTETLHLNGTLRVAVLPEDGEQLIFTNNSGKAEANHDQRYTSYRVVVADKNGVLGLAPAPPVGYFYMPPVLLPLSEYAMKNSFKTTTEYTYTPAPAGTQNINGTYKVDLHKLYEKQFKHPQATSSTTSELPFHGASELDFFVTYYDPAVFANVTLSNAGILTYSVKKQQVAGVWKDISPTGNTLMNIIFRVK